VPGCATRDFVRFKNLGPRYALAKFAAECRRQSLRVANDPQERAVMDALESGLGDMTDWKS